MGNGCPCSGRSSALSLSRSRRTSRGTTTPGRLPRPGARGSRVALEVRNRLLAGAGGLCAAGKARRRPGCKAKPTRHRTRGRTRTAPWGYLRLRKTAYTPGELAQWSKKIAAQGWEEAFVFFKHEQIAPDLAQKLTEAAVK